MYNWSVDEGRFRRSDPESYKLWRLQQRINHGLRGEKLDRKLLEKYWKRLYMDAPTRNYLRFLLWQKKKLS